MRECTLLILGGGHVALGLAVAQRDSLICEESEFLDAGFSLTLKNFKRDNAISLSEPAEKLLACYETMGLVSATQFHCGALEIGASRFALDNGVAVLLKCRLIKLEQCGEAFHATFITNEGLLTVRAKQIADTRPKGPAKTLSVLFAIVDSDSLSRVKCCFPDGCVEQSFCPEWGVLHMPVEPETDYNAALHLLLNRWKVSEKLALIAPRLTYEASQTTPTDSAFSDPLVAFEAGYRWGKEGV